MLSDNEFLDRRGLADTGAARQTNVSTTGILCEQTSGLDTHLLQGVGCLTKGRVSVDQARSKSSAGPRSSMGSQMMFTI